nr:helix-turn-helix transcriptional regulator [Stenotrophomonas sp. MYb238]
MDRDGDEGDVVRRDDLLTGMDLLGSGYLFSREPEDDLPLLAGRMRTRELRNGLVLHCTEAHDLQTLETEAENWPGIKIALLVDGASELGYGSHRFRLGPCDDAGRPRGGNAGALVNFAEPDRFRRRWQAGRAERKVVITLKPEWIASSGLLSADAGKALQRFLREHMATTPWTPSAHALSAAEAILRPPPLLPCLLDMHREARCLDIVTEACSVIAGEAPAAAAPGPGQRRRLQALRALLDSGQADGWSLQRMARHVGSNPTSLQQAFRATFGITVVAYLRERRLQQAHERLLRGRDSLAWVAQHAGYTSSANFCTAFKRRFGITPGQVMRQMG